MDEEDTNKQVQTKKRNIWEVHETMCFLAILKELNVVGLMDGKKFRTTEIFKKVESKFTALGFSRTSQQLLEKYKTIKKNYTRTKNDLSKSGAGTEAINNCPHFEELTELFSNRPMVIKKGVDSTIIPSEAGITEGSCNVGLSQKVCTQVNDDFNPKVNTVENCIPRPSEHIGPYTLCPAAGSSQSSPQFQSPTRNSILESPFIPIPSPSPQSDPDDPSIIEPSVPSPTTFTRTASESASSCLSSSASSASTPQPGQSIKRSRAYSSRRTSHSALKEVVNSFASQIIQSQENLLAKTLEEQRKIDEMLFKQYNEMFSRQTEMLLTGLQQICNPRHNVTSPMTYGQSQFVGNPSHEVGFQTFSPMTSPLPPQRSFNYVPLQQARRRQSRSTRVLLETPETSCMEESENYSVLEEHEDDEDY